VQLARLVESHWIRPRGDRAARFAWFLAYALCLTGALGGSVVGVVKARAGIQPPEDAFAAMQERWLDPGGAQPISCDDRELPADVAAISREEPWTSYILFVCSEDYDAIPPLDEELTRYLELEGSVDCLLPPWRMNELSAAARRRIEGNRALFRELIRRDQEVLESWNREVPVTDRELEQLAGERRSASERLRSERPPRDAEEAVVFQLFEEWYLSDPKDPEDIELLGRSTRHCLQDDRAEIVIESILDLAANDWKLRLALVMSQPEESFQPVLDYLCRAGCRVAVRVGSVVE
jgi:hypothetical protein